MRSEHTVDTRSALRLVLAPVRKRLTVAVVAAGLGGVLGVVGFALIANALRELSTPRSSGGDVAFWIGGAAFAVLLRFALRTLSFRISHIASYDLETVLRERLTTQLAAMPLGAVQRMGSGRVKKIVQDDVRALHGLVADATPLAGVAVATPIAAVTMMLFADWRMTLAALAMVPLALWAMWWTRRDHPDRRQRYDDANEAVNAAVVELANGMPVVRTFDDGRTTFARFHRRVTEFTTAIHEWNALSRGSALLTRTFIAPLPTLLVIVAVGVLLIGAGSLDLATLVLFLLIGTSVVEAVTPLMWLHHYVADSKAAALRITGLLESPTLPEPSIPESPKDGSIRFSGVRFGYVDADRPVLDGLDLEVPAGTMCAIVGPSGAGKSTIARLIPRFFDVDEGAVFVGGVDVRQIESQVLLRHLGLVFQEPFLIEDTVAANIRLGRPNASGDDVRTATKVAMAHDFVVSELPSGYDTVVGERGARLSGGQRQRIALARAVLADAPIVVFDEATAFADPENEALIQDAIAGLACGKTLIVIAHRLTSVVAADQIVVVESGRVVERGQHDELLALDGSYARLWRHSVSARQWRLGDTGGAA